MSPSSKSKLKLNLLAFSFLTLGPVQAGGLQVFSVKENPPGTVSATVGLFADTMPSPAAFRLRLDDKTTIPAGEVKTAASFTPEMSVIICVDQSGSMSLSRIKQIQEALRGALAKSEPQLKELKLNVALWAFDTEVKKLRGFSKDNAQLTRSIDQIGRDAKPDGRSKLWEAIELGLAELRSRDEADLKRLIVITDGKDEGSSISDQIIASKANAQNIAIDAIGFGRVEKKDSELLGRLAKNTGGQYISATESRGLVDALQRLFNLPAPRVFNVSFRYEVAANGHQIQSAQLEFTPAGKAAVLQTITQGLSAPRVIAPPVPAPDDKWTINILSIKIDLRVLIGILVGILALVGAYILSKRPARSPKPEFSSPPPPPSSSKAAPPPRAASKRSQTLVAYAFPAPSQGHPAAILRCLSGPAKGQQYPVEHTTYRIGSGEGNELQLSDDYLSRKHASVQYDSGNLYLSDSGSRNGTFLNDSQLDQTARALTPGDRIRIGKSTLEVLAVSSQSYSPQTFREDEPLVP